MAFHKTANVVQHIPQSLPLDNLDHQPLAYLIVSRVHSQKSLEHLPDEDNDNMEEGGDIVENDDTEDEASEESQE